MMISVVNTNQLQIGKLFILKKSQFLDKLDKPAQQVVLQKDESVFPHI